MNKDLTRGSVMGSKLLFAVPMILGNLLRQCYNIADTLIVGQFLGKNALAAVGSSFTLMTFLTSILLGLCMGSGEGMWIPMGDTRWEGLTYENHTSYPSKVEMLIYPGGISEMEMILAYGSVCFASKVGQLAGNHFLTITDGLDRLYALGRKCLYEGAQPITIELE